MRISKGYWLWDYFLKRKDFLDEIKSQVQKIKKSIFETHNAFRALL